MECVNLSVVSLWPPGLLCKANEKAAPKYVEQGEKILDCIESSVAGVSVVIQGFFHMFIVDSIVISCIYRQVMLAILQCSVRLTLVQCSSQNCHLCIWQMCTAWLNPCTSFFSPLIILILVPASLKT